MRISCYLLLKYTIDRSYCLGEKIPISHKVGSLVAITHFHTIVFCQTWDGQMINLAI